MATSVIQIINNALSRIGVDSIIDLQEDNAQGRLANLTYEQIRDDVIADHVWNFSIKRIELAQDTSTPSFGYSYQYALPSDCIKVLAMEEVTMKYEIEGRKLLTDEGTARIKYISRVTDPNEFSPKFIEALSARMAAEWAVPLVDSSTLQQNMYEIYLRKLSDARSVDSQESGSNEIIADTWLDSRLNYAGSLTVDVNT